MKESFDSVIKDSKLTSLQCALLCGWIFITIKLLRPTALSFSQKDSTPVVTNGQRC